MRCTVFRSSSKDFHYIYLADGYGFDDLPASLRQLFEAPQEVIRLDLDKLHKLANADLASVRKHLEDRGWYLQLPPERTVEEILDEQMG